GHLRCIDRLLSDFAQNKHFPLVMLNRLKRILAIKKQLPFKFRLLCLFGIGLSATILSGADPSYYLLGGMTTTSIEIIVYSLNNYLRLFKLFNEFLACFLAFVTASFANHYFNLPTPVFTIGTLAFVVPGLLMTTAISEVVDQNYLSGTIRLLKTASTLMAMALAYFLSKDISHFLGWQDSTHFYLHTNFIPPIWLKLSASIIIIFSFSLLFQAHRKSLLRILLCGLSGTLTFSLFVNNSYMVLASFAAAFTIGFVSYKISRRFNHPSQIYSVPSILSLVPGMLAFSSFGYSSSAINFGINSAVQALLVSLAIVFGLALGRIKLNLKKIPY
ncbi:MAG: threonine/serine exporter family protein, partial [Bdellovibrionales bacterium]|nr:threonine/serine exporter family protein [Bdellovibrionales bacterium]